MKSALAHILAGMALLNSSVPLLPAQDTQFAPGTAFGPDATAAAPLHAQSNVEVLSNLSSKASLTGNEVDQARNAMLAINNEARANPEYRKTQKCKTFLKLPAGLPPLVLDDACNKAAQEQAEYQASRQQLTHDNLNYGNDFGKRLAKHGIGGALEACGMSTSLASYPISWMKSETHHRPTWNLGGNEADAPYPVRKAGYGAAKGRDGKWYCTALWLPVDDKDKAALAAMAAMAATVPGGTPPGEGENLALGKDATQSSTLFNGEAKLAVNGNTSGRYDPDPAKTDITHTDAKPGSWWQVDLGKSCDIKSIYIYNRADMNWERLQNFYIMISEDAITENCKQSNSEKGTVVSGPHSFTTGDYQSLGLGVGLTRKCKGRYVRIFLDNGDMPLSLGEVQVLGK